MKITVIGTGYVGLVTGTCFADVGHTVWCVDVNEEKIKNLKNGIIPIYEPGLTEMVIDNYKNKKLNFTTNFKSAIIESEICFIAVGTPMDEDGSADLHYVLDVAKSIGRFMDKHMYIINKSTVPVGTAKKVREEIQNILDTRNSNLTFDVISNPEFLKEGTAVSDCMKPDRIVIGVNNKNSEKVMREIYKPVVITNEKFIVMDILSSEMTKYAANAMLATKISFINEISNICERVGADVTKVRKGIGSDQRIGYSFIYAGCGYGGSCFPKDVKALIKTADEYNYSSNLLKSVEKVNEEQKYILVDKIKNHFGEMNLKGKTFAMWGLSFKPNTDDMREAPSLTIINELTKLGAYVISYDPKAMEEAKKHYLKDNSNVTFGKNKYDILDNADGLILVTEWKEFRSPDFHEITNRLKENIIFDGRNQYDLETMEEYNIKYIRIGVKSI